MAKQYFKAVSILSLLALVLAFVPAGSVHADPSPPLPTVNGLYYLDGDIDNYYYLGPTTQTRGTIYYRLEGTTMYLAIVVSTDVNDNVFGMKGTDGAYLASADWSAVHTANRLIGSDHLEIALQCGANSWDWFQDYVYADGAGGWLSDSLGPDGGGTPPPGLVTASSVQWNLGQSAWDYTAGRDPNDDNTWLSLNQGDPNTIEDDGWPTSQGDPLVNTEQDPAWEWAMVYEMSMDVSACEGEAITVWPVSAHNSPAKDGDEDIPFEPVDLLDFGDAPNSYGTLLASDGARHYLVVGGPYLGPSVDAETDGQPDVMADGDDLTTQNDADGVIFLSPVSPGWPATIQVTGSAGAYLDAWIDFDGNGTFDADEHITWVLTGGADILTIDVPADAVTGQTYARFRVSSAGGLGPTGLAPDGEVEDYVLPLIPTSVELLSFTARPQGRAILVQWETASEIDNAGFNLYRATSLEGEKTRMNGNLIPSQVPPGSPIGAVYSWLDSKVVSGTVYYYWLEDVDIYGRATLHEPVKVKAQSPSLVPSAPSLTGR